jgi:hypothetical protein
MSSTTLTAILGAVAAVAQVVAGAYAFVGGVQDDTKLQTKLINKTGDPNNTPPEAAIELVNAFRKKQLQICAGAAVVGVFFTLAALGLVLFDSG